MAEDGRGELGVDAAHERDRPVLEPTGQPGARRLAVCRRDELRPGRQRMTNLIELENTKHDPDCKFGKAAGGIAIECEHGYDVCPICDPCTCQKKPQITS